MLDNTHYELVDANDTSPKNIFFFLKPDHLRLRRHADQFNEEEPRAQSCLRVFLGSGGLQRDTQSTGIMELNILRVPHFQTDRTFAFPVL